MLSFDYDHNIGGELSEGKSLLSSGTPYDQTVDQRVKALQLNRLLLYQGFTVFIFHSITKKVAKNTILTTLTCINCFGVIRGSIGFSRLL